ncbi:hypothetical protein [Paracoccus actinidiae]|uniref:hypothetical protein n=1 Tax=Paracoccus actinidiae TaxID=3064531 RepID=UPI0027D1F765|nr:hypothetical protein [Paracoccus sp. M09]
MGAPVGPHQLIGEFLQRAPDTVREVLLTQVCQTMEIEFWSADFDVEEWLKNKIDTGDLVRNIEAAVHIACATDYVLDLSKGNMFEWHAKLPNKSQLLNHMALAAPLKAAHWQKLSQDWQELRADKASNRALFLEGNWARSQDISL